MYLSFEFLYFIVLKVWGPLYFYFLVIDC